MAGELFADPEKLLRLAEVDFHEVVDLLDLEPLPVEGGMFRQTWQGALVGDRAAGTAIVAALSPRGDHFSAMHRLPHDETWHFYLGDPIEMLLLDPDKSWRLVRLGSDIRRGDHLQLTVLAGTWMGASVVESGDWAVFGCTMAPGFLHSDYEGGDVEELCRSYPDVADRIRRLCRPVVRLATSDPVPIDVKRR
jgi:predicted cupin superfamily sugar epimerase